MSEWTLDASSRTVRGKGGARQVRREGFVPAVVYGAKDPIAVKVPERETSRMLQRLHGSSQLVTLRFSAEDGGNRQVLVKEVQTTPVGGALLHIDFNEISADHKVRVTVELRAVGTPEGVKLGGTQQTVMYEIPIECLPGQLPDAIEVDVSHMQIGDAIHIGDLSFPEGVRPLAEDDAAVIVISGQMKEEEEEVEAVEGEEGEEAEAAAEGEEGEAEGGAEEPKAEED